MGHKILDITIEHYEIPITESLHYYTNVQNKPKNRFFGGSWYDKFQERLKRSKWPI